MFRVLSTFASKSSRTFEVKLTYTWDQRVRRFSTESSEEIGAVVGSNGNAKQCDVLGAGLRSGTLPSTI